MDVYNTSAMHLPPGDVNRDADWDWTQNVPYTLHYQAQEGPEPVTVDLPYFTNEGPAGVDLEINGDFRREDGWVLLYRDFGTEARPATLPMFLLYNKYRGVLRLFYFNTLDEAPNSFATGVITQGSPDRAAALLTYGQRDYFLNSYDKTLAVSTTHEIEPMVWNYVDFAIIGYDPRLPTDAALDITLFAVKKSDVALDGDITMDQILKQGQVSDFQRVWQAIKSGYQMYKTVDSAKDDLQKKVDNPENATKWWREPLQQLLTFAGEAEEYFPELAGLAMFAYALVSGGPKRVAPLKFEGELQLKGTLTNPNQLHSFQIRVPGAPRSLPDDQVDGLPLYDVPLGLFNLIEEPHVLTRTLHLGPDEENPGGATKMHYRLREPLQIVTNPHLSDTTIRLEFGYVFSRAKTSYIPANAPLFTSIFDASENSTFQFLQGLATVAKVTPQGTEPILALNTFDAATSTGNI